MPEPRRLLLPSSYGVLSPFTLENAPAWDDIEPALEHSRNYWLLLTDREIPHATPVWGIWHETEFFFCTDPQSKKARLIRDFPRAAIHLESADDVIVVHGTISATPLRMIDMFLRLYLMKYGVTIEAGDPDQAFYRLIPQTAMTWLERDFQRTAASWEF